MPLIWDISDDDEAEEIFFCILLIVRKKKHENKEICIFPKFNKIRNVELFIYLFFLLFELIIA